MNLADVIEANEQPVRRITMEQTLQNTEFRQEPRPPAITDLWEAFLQLREITMDDTQYPSIELYPNRSGIVDFRGHMIEFGSFEGGIKEINDIVWRWRDKVAHYGRDVDFTVDDGVPLVAPSDAPQPAPSEPDSESALVHHARHELQRAYIADADTDVAVSNVVMDVVNVFAERDLEQCQMAAALGLLDKLLRFQPLTPLTSDPDEWMDVSEASGGNPMWQSRRKASVFSKDGGQTWYDLDDTAEVQAALDNENLKTGYNDLAAELRALDDLVRQQEKAQHIGYAGSLLERLRAVLNRYEWITEQTLAAAKVQRDDVLVFLRALALVLESIGNGATHREKDARLRGGVEMLESAIKRLREVEFDTRPGTHRRADIFRSDYPVREFLDRIHDLEAENRQLVAHTPSDDLPY